MCQLSLVLVTFNMCTYHRGIVLDEDDTAFPEPPLSNNNTATAIHTPTKAETKIEVGGIDLMSDLSSVSESPFTEKSTTARDIAPPTPSLGIGIAAPTQRYLTGSRIYVDDISVDGNKEWKMRSCMLQTP